MRPVFFLLIAAGTAAWGADAQRLMIGAPMPFTAISGTITFTTSTLDTGTKRVEHVFQAEDAAVVTTLLFRYGTRTGTPVQHRICIQGVSTTDGNANGTLAACAAFTPPADTSWNSTVRAVSLSHDGSGGSQTSYTLTRGNFYAMVIEPCPNSTAPCSGAATPDASNSSSFTTVLTSGFWGSARQGFPYAGTFNGTAWTKTADLPVYGYRSASRTYGTPIQSHTATTISSGSEQGVSFTIPAGVWGSYKILGVRAGISTPAASKSVKVVLYSGTTVLQSLTWDTDIAAAAVSGVRTIDFFFSDTTLQSLTTGNTYRIGFAPQDSSNLFALSTIDLAASGDRTAFSGGDMFTYTTRSSCGAPCDTTSTSWNDTNTSRPLVTLILDDITGGSGGGQKGYAW